MQGLLETLVKEILMSKNKWIFDLLMDKTKKFNKKSPIRVYTSEELEVINEHIRDGKSVAEAIEVTSEIS